MKRDSSLIALLVVGLFFQSIMALAAIDKHKHFNNTDSTIVWDEAGQKHPVFKGLSERYFVLPPLPVNQLANGEIVALTYGPKILIATLISGQIPPGMLLAPNGILLVNNRSLLQPGDYSLVIETFDENHKVYKNAITVSITPPGAVNLDALFSMRKPKYVHQYQDGEVVAIARDPDGKTIDALIIGELPPGMTLSQQGSLVVSEVKNLRAGTYHIWVATADENYGVTLFTITLELLSAPETANDKK